MVEGGHGGCDGGGMAKIKTYERPRFRKGLWLQIAIAVISLVIGIAFWWWMGSGRG